MLKIGEVARQYRTLNITEDYEREKEIEEKKGSTWIKGRETLEAYKVANTHTLSQIRNCLSSILIAPSLLGQEIVSPHESWRVLTWERPAKAYAADV